jgi:hypothetical protein
MKAYKQISRHDSAHLFYTFILWEEEILRAFEDR